MSTLPVAVCVRVNLLGYLEDEGKFAVAFSQRKIEAESDLVDGTTEAMICVLIKPPGQIPEKETENPVSDTRAS